MLTALVLLRRYGQLALVLLLAGLVARSCHQRDQALEQRGRAIERTMQLDRQVASLTTKHRADSLRADSLERVARADTVALTRWLTRWDTARVAFNVHDTVSVIRTVAAADSTIRACRAAVSSLAMSCAAKDTVIADQRQIIAALRSASPVLAKDRRFSLGITAGYGATLHQGQINTGPSATLGVHWRIF